MKESELHITIDDRKIKKFINAAKMIIKSIQKDAKKLEKMGFNISIQVKTDNAVNKIVNESIMVK